MTGFLGVGGGFLAVPALVGVLGLRMKQAVGTSLLVITVNSLAALTARTGTGADLRWEVIAPSPVRRSSAPGTANASQPRSPARPCNGSSPTSCWWWRPSCSPT
ncbi:TSUP family transporter [Streptomyces sp. C8S0]|uniref:TSUP family transporter n=1 Tax=Streptomyces sp. C8S0 TaxID=2585716 RepID=UPI0039AF06E8